MKHDNSSECPPNAYIMSPSSYVAMDNNAATFYRFSTCSVQYMQNYLQK